MTQEEREEKIKRLKELKELARPFTEKGGLTKVEALEFTAIMRSISDLRFDLAKPLPLEKIPSREERESDLPSEIVLIARNDLLKNKFVYDAIDSASVGVSFNAETEVDVVMGGGNKHVTARQFYDAFSDTRDALRSHYGKTITLYRAVGLQKKKLTTNWATTRKLAQAFGSKIKVEDISIDRVVAVNVGLSGRYEEVVVLDEERAISNNPLGRDSLKDEANAYARRQDVEDAIEIVRSHQELMRAGGWGTFKSRLWKILFPGQTYPGLKWDVPLEFIYAQKVTSGWTRVDAYRQVIRGGR